MKNDASFMEKRIQKGIWFAQSIEFFHFQNFQPERKWSMSNVEKYAIACFMVPVRTCAGEQAFAYCISHWAGMWKLSGWKKIDGELGARD